MKDNKNYIKVKYNVNINDEQIFVITDNKEILLTKENAKRMSRILSGYKGTKINNLVYIYKDYDKIIAEFLKKKNTKKVNRNKSRRIALGIISGSLVTLLLSGVYTQMKNKKILEPFVQVTEANDDIELPVMKNPYITNDNSIDKKFIKVEEKAKSVYIPKFESINYSSNESVDKIKEFYYDFSGYDSDGKKAFDHNTVEKSKQYREFYEKYGKMYGIDPNLLLLIGAQEQNGQHKIVPGAPAIGLMQIEAACWLGKKIEVWNFEINDYETIYIDSNKITDVEYNIKYGAALLRYCIDYSEKKVKKDIVPENDFLAFSAQTYNMGETNMNLILKYPGNWSDNRKYIAEGDSEYIEHVFCEAPSDVAYWLKTKDGTIHYFTMTNMNDYVYSQAPSGHSLR